MIKILPSITTINADWRAQIKEIDQLGLVEVAVFPTAIELEERKELCALLRKTSLQKVPLVHLRDDMSAEEIEFFVKNYQTGAFNCHAGLLKKIQGEWAPYHKMIYIENTYKLWNEAELQECGGICIDFSHLENDHLLLPERRPFEFEIIKKYPCGCAHISAIKHETYVDKYDGRDHYDAHELKEFSEMDYLKAYPREFFPEITAIEVKNPLAEQLKIGEYVRKLIA